MVNLRTHEERMKAIETAYNEASSATDKVQIVLSAAQLDRENFYMNRDNTAAGAGAAFQKVISH